MKKLFRVSEAIVTNNEASESMSSPASTSSLKNAKSLNTNFGCLGEGMEKV